MPEAAPKGFGAKQTRKPAERKAPTLTPKQAHDKIEESLTSSTQLVASYFLITNDAFCHSVMKEIGPKWASMSADMADQSEFLRDALLKLAGANVLISFIVMTGVMVAPILAHHGVLPERLMALPMVFNLLQEEDIEALMNQMAEQQAQAQGTGEGSES